MNKQLTDTVFYVTGKGELQSFENREIEVLLKEHPYFAPAQLLLVAKLKNENSYNIKEQTQKASLFFNNSRWFQYQLSEIKLEGANFDYKGIEAATSTIDSNSIENLISEVVFEKNEEVKDLQNTISLEESKIEEDRSYNEIFIPNYFIPTVEHIKDIYNGIDDTTKNLEPVTSIKEISNNELKEEVTVKNEVDESVENLIVVNKLGMAAVKEKWEKPLDDVKEELLPFEAEPYYTIDYFASQGIQFDFNKQPHDKLTTKMLKFTDWLKKMKGIKPENMVFEEDDELNQTIQNIAFNSNVSKEIVTETMAEVFAKQGKTEKAIQLYIKLSFLIPHKSSYFASKIQELKGI